MLTIIDLDQSYVEEALVLARAEYERERAAADQLPEEFPEEQIKGMIYDVFTKKLGKIALEDGKCVGYLAFYGPFEGFFGNVTGAFSPLGCSAFTGIDRGKLASRLFEAVSTDLVEQGIVSLALSRYTHDTEVGTSFVMNGFGIRCSDGVMKLSERKVNQEGFEELNQKYVFKELAIENKRKIKALKDGLTRHMASAPIFFPTDLSNDDAWFDRDEIRVFAACKGEEAVGYFALRGDGETFVADHEKMQNICGTYVDPPHRGEGIAQWMLEKLCVLCEQEGNTYLGVDCETLNPTALRFWGKYFQNYTYSYARRIDERVVGYKEYMDQVFGKE